MATCGYDSQIKLWSVKEEADLAVLPLACINLNENRSDCLQWNPNVENIMVSTSLNTIYLWDIETQTNLSANRNHSEAIQSLSWKRDGSLLVTTSKDKTMQIIDPRNGRTSENLLFESDKTANKDSRVQWIESSNCILSSNYTANFQREVLLWDIRNPAEPVHESDIGTGNNVLVPYYDYDASVLYLIGKAETMVHCGEVSIGGDNWKFTLNSSQQVDEQIKSACLLPKFGVDLMKCELDRLIILGRGSVYPLPYFVPRRSYYEFHADAYPMSYNTSAPGVAKSEWINGENRDAVRCMLNLETQKDFLEKNVIPSCEIQASPVVEAKPPSPKKQIKPEPVAVREEKPAERISVSAFVSSLNNNSNSPSSEVMMPPPEVPKIITPTETTPVVASAVKPAEKNVREPSPVVFRSTTNGHTNGTALTTPSNGTSGLRHTPSLSGSSNRSSRVKSVYYQSKFKYIDGKPVHKNDQITNIRNLSTMWPSECDGFHVNEKHAAFLIAGSSGQIGIVEV